MTQRTLVPEEELEDLRIHEIFSPDTFNHIIGFQARWRGHRIGAKITMSEECYRQYQNDPTHKLCIRELLIEEMRAQAARLRVPEEEPQRRLRARWTMEAEQDLRAMHNLDAEALMADLLASELNEEVTLVGNNRVWKQSKLDFFEINWKKEGF